MVFPLTTKAELSVNPEPINTEHLLYDFAHYWPHLNQCFATFQHVLTFGKIRACFRGKIEICMQNRSAKLNGARASHQ